MRPQILEMERLSRELQAKDSVIKATKGELQAKDTELRFRDTTISALEKKVKKVEDEKDRRLETVVNLLLKHRGSLEAIADFKYKCRYDGVISDLRTRLGVEEEAYLAKCRALAAVTAEYSQVVAFASSNGTIPPPDEPTLARILMEYQEERMLSEESEEGRRRLERASERRRRILNYRVTPR
ncbi:hypothetical protein IWQ61_006079 [Dispira simplex]|nr:hypothetical protein IWQ61_006079 [Dispira simplex]